MVGGLVPVGPTRWTGPGRSIWVNRSWTSPGRSYLHRSVLLEPVSRVAGTLSAFKVSWQNWGGSSGGAFHVNGRRSSGLWGAVLCAALYVGVVRGAVLHGTSRGGYHLWRVVSPWPSNRRSHQAETATLQLRRPLILPCVKGVELYKSKHFDPLYRIEENFPSAIDLRTVPSSELDVYVFY